MGRYLIILVFLLSLTVSADEIDSTGITILSDSTDSMLAPEDSTVFTDSLSETERARLSFEKRKKQFEKEELVKAKPYLSFEDSLNTYFLIPRFDRKKTVTRGIAKDAGDYFKYDPSFFNQDYQTTPLRNSVQPFGLSGNRLNIIHNGMILTPFEHLPEPNGGIDLNDIPTALDDRIYILPGGAGQIFGGSQSVASLITLSDTPDDYRPNSALMVDKGAFGYSYVRGKYGKKYKSGKKISASVGYRKAQGATGFQDDGFHYTGKAILPLGKDYYLRASGQIYDRDGMMAYYPDEPNFGIVKRSRIDRSVQLLWEKLNADHTGKYYFGYKYLRQNSNSSGDYDGKFDVNANDYLVGREMQKGNLMYQAELSFKTDNYRNGIEKFDRNSGRVFLKMINYRHSYKLAVIGGSEYVDGYRLLPFGAVMLVRDSSNFSYILSLGYSERAPTLHELNLNYHQSAISPITPLLYVDYGNSDLASEKQLAGSILCRYGSALNYIEMALTGGLIKDGIDWSNHVETGSMAQDVRIFTPINGDIDFYDIKFEYNLNLNNFINWQAGGAYHKLNYDKFDDKRYSPEYEIYTGAELHVYWPQKYTDLFAYAEIVYPGEYYGYNGRSINRQPIVNAKLAFEIKNFRFNFIWRNALLQSYQTRELFTNLSRTTYYSFTWKFFD